jgi:putative flippase GtrA
MVGSGARMDIVNLPGVAAARRPEPPDQLQRGANLSRTSTSSKRSTRLQYLRFCTVGVSNAVVDLAALNLLLLLYPTRSDLTLLVYNTVAVMLAILNSYLWNTRWTFHDQVTNSGRERALFVAQAILNIAINNVVLVVMTDLLPTQAGGWSILTTNLAKLAAMFTASSTSFLLLHTFVFRARAS